MADRPIIFSAPMVRALLDGRKTQTRRIVRDMPAMPSLDNYRHDPRHEAPYLDSYCGDRKTPENPRGMSDRWGWWTRDDRPGPLFRVPAAPGDRLYVRESIERANGEAVGFPADGSWLPNTPWRWKNARLPSIHMPRELSRLTLIVEGVKMERLQDISEEDASAEGAHVLGAAERHDQRGNRRWVLGHCRECAGWDPATMRKTAVCPFRSGDERDHRDHSGAGCSTSFQLRTEPEPSRFQFENLWGSLHFKPGETWRDNPFVVALTFSVAHGNIDQLAVPA